MYSEVLLQNDEVLLPCFNNIHFDLRAMWNIGVLEILSKEEEKVSKFIAFDYVQRLVVRNDKFDKMLVEGRK